MTRDLTSALVSDSEPDKPTTKHVRTQPAKAAQRERIRALTAEGYTVVRGQTGLTLFRFGGW
jgi:hypothetical protein